MGVYRLNQQVQPPFTGGRGGLNQKPLKDSTRRCIIGDPGHGMNAGRPETGGIIHRFIEG